MLFSFKWQVFLRPAHMLLTRLSRACAAEINGQLVQCFCRQCSTQQPQQLLPFQLSKKNTWHFAAVLVV